MKKQKIYDISIELSDNTLSYPGDTRFKRTILPKETCCLSEISMSAHSGTHIDAPLHFIEGGETIDKLDLNNLVTTAHVIEVTNKQFISKNDIKTPGNAILFKTDNSVNNIYNKKFNKNYTYLDESAARYCVELNAGLVGIDFLTIDGPNSSHPSHYTLLSKGIIILEGIDLSEVKPGVYKLICLPLKIKDGDGSPVRAVLLP